MTIASPEQLTQAWQDLQALAPITVIHTAEQYDRAVETLDMLLDTVGTDERHPLYELVDTLGTLVHDYEERNEGAPGPTNIALLRFFMQEHDLSPADLPEVGDASAVSDMLAERRPIASPELQALARRFGVTPETFIADT